MRKALPAFFAGALLIASCSPSTTPSASAGIADHLGISVQPSIVDVGTVMAPSVKVQVRDATGGVVDSSAVDKIVVTVTPGSGSAIGQTITGTDTQNVVHGVATFNDLRFSLEGTGFTLTFTAVGMSDVVSNPFDVTNNANFIYFASNRSGVWEVWRMKDDGSLQTKVTNRSMLSNPFPAKSSSTSQVAFSDGAYGLQSLWTMNPDGTGVRQVVTLSDAGEPAWSPDGRTIASRVTNASPGFGLFSVQASGSGRLQLTSGPDDSPTYSPDGESIAFSELDSLGRRGIYVTSAGGGLGVAIDTLGTNETHPAWSPDGQRIAFVSDRTGNNEIWVMNITGSTQVQVTTNAADDDFPSWSPDGTKILFHSSRAGNYDIWSMNADGTGLLQLTTNAGTDKSPSWWN